MRNRWKQIAEQIARLFCCSKENKKQEPSRRELIKTVWGYKDQLFTLFKGNHEQQSRRCGQKKGQLDARFFAVWYNEKTFRSDFFWEKFDCVKSMELSAENRNRMNYVEQWFSIYYHKPVHSYIHETLYILSVVFGYDIILFFSKTLFEFGSHWFW